MSGDVWAMDAFRLLMNAPRVYRPLAEAWEECFPGTLRALSRLVSMGFVAHQPAVVVDTRTGGVAERAGRPVPRYVITAAGRRLLAESEEDLRFFEDRFPQVSIANVRGAVRLLGRFALEGSNARLGVSAGFAGDGSGLADRTARWWVSRFHEEKLLRRLPVDLPDVRAVVPEHWRVTRQLCRQLSDVLVNVDGAPVHLVREFRLKRDRFLSDIEPARVGAGGATDYDHDVTTQEILAAMLRSGGSAPEGIFAVEPRLSLPVDRSSRPWGFVRDGGDVVFYQPDAELRERTAAGARRSVLEYERYQTRRDAWSHIERFCGMLHTTSFGVEPAVLRFVVDTPGRVRYYVELIEAFCDYAHEFPERMPANPVTLAVSDVARVVGPGGGLDLDAWFRIDLPSGELPAGVDRVPLLHRKEESSYSDYF